METPVNPEQKPFYTETIYWKGTEHKLRFFPCKEAPAEFTYSQCQAVPFTEDGQVVMQRHIDGYNSLPGGTVDDGEKYEEALKREVFEESACDVIRCGVFGYFEDTNSETGEIKYQLRYWAVVEPRDEDVNDPDGKALERIIVNEAEAAEILGWGEKGEVLIKLAKAALR